MYRRDIEKEWQDFKMVLLSYPETFNPQVADRTLFMRIFAQVCSRCFGWGLPSTSMIPMADNLNHSHGTCINETIHTTFHLKYTGDKPHHGGVPKHYFTREKFMNDYSAIFSEQEIQQSPINTLGGRFSRDNFNRNIEKYSLDTLRKEVDSKMLWDMTWKEDDVSEDNDTEEEESEEEDYLEDDEYLKRISQKKSEGKINELINPKKGFKFFIE